MTSTTVNVKRIFPKSLVLFVVAMLSCMAIPLFAAAPVYDASSLPQQVGDADIGAGPEASDPTTADASGSVESVAQQDATGRETYDAPADAQNTDEQGGAPAEASSGGAVGFQPTNTTHESHFNKATHAKDTWPTSSPSPDEGTDNTNSADNYPTSDVDTSSLTLKQRMHQVELRLDNIQNGEGSAKIDALQSQIQTLTGQLEDMSHQLQLMKEQQKAFYDDVNHRIMNVRVAPVAMVSQPRAVANAVTVSNGKVGKGAKQATTQPLNNGVLSKNTSAAATMPNDSGVAPSSASSSMEEQQLYQTAYNFIKVRKYSDAITTLQTMLKKYPSGQFASNAHYWLGELYGVMGNNSQALTEFNNVVTNYPKSLRTADAQLKVGLILASQSDWPEARKAFKKVVSHYPGTASSKLAAEQLRQLKIAGH